MPEKAKNWVWYATLFGLAALLALGLFNLAESLWMIRMAFVH
jgi:hypothetical protein